MCDPSARRGAGTGSARRAAAHRGFEPSAELIAATDASVREAGAYTRPLFS